MQVIALQSARRIIISTINI